MHVSGIVVPHQRGYAPAFSSHSHDSSTPIAPENAIRSTMDPFSLSTGVVGLIAVALKLVVGTLGLIDKTVAAYDEATEELKGLQQVLEQLQTQMVRIHGTLDVLVSNTKDRVFKKLLKKYAPHNALIDKDYY